MLFKILPASFTFLSLFQLRSTAWVQSHVCIWICCMQKLLDILLAICLGNKWTDTKSGFHLKNQVHYIDLSIFQFLLESIPYESVTFFCTNCLNSYNLKIEISLVYRICSANLCKSWNHLMNLDVLWYFLHEFAQHTLLF